MSYSSGRSGKKNKFSPINAYKYASIEKYVERIEERRQAPGRLRNGIMEVLVHGCHWVSVEEFERIMPAYIVQSFSQDSSNCDKTKSFLLP